MFWSFRNFYSKKVVVLKFPGNRISKFIGNVGHYLKPSVLRIPSELQSKLFINFAAVYKILMKHQKKVLTNKIVFNVSFQSEYISKY